MVEQQHSSHSGSTPSILSEKVNRALAVRTDTPALSTALKALSQLPLVDSRSVRAAIEQDALRQAVCLQDALCEIVEAVGRLRRDCTAAAQTATAVRRVIHTSVLTTETAARVLHQQSQPQQDNDGNAVPAGGDAEKETNSSAAATASAEETSALLLDEQPPQQQQSSNDDGAQQAAEAATSSSSSHAEAQLAAVLAEAFRHRDQAQQRLRAVHAFLQQFDLSAADSDLLDRYNFQDTMVATTTTAAGVAAAGADALQQENSAPTMEQGWAFLQALERVRHIRAALHVQFGGAAAAATAASGGGDSMGGSSSSNTELNSQSALRMMESLAAKQEAAYERLYHWLQQNLNSSSGSNSIHDNRDGTTDAANAAAERTDEWLQHEFVQQAVWCLRAVPAFYRHTLEACAAQRRAETTRRFLLALTEGYHGQPPLEVKAHDSVQYVGDMLAFAFRAFSVEAELARGLLHYQPPREDDDEDEEPKSDGDNDEQDETKAAETEKALQHPVQEYDDSASSPEDATLTADGMLAVSLSGLCRPLKARILQVIASLARRDDEHGNGGPDDDSVGSDSDDDDADFEEEGTVTRTRVTHLYEICGLLLFYASTMEKGVHKLHSMSSSMSLSEEAHEQNKDEEASSALSAPNTKNPLVECLLECLGEASQAYEATQRVYAAMLDQLSVLTGDSEAALVHSMLVLITDVRLKSPGFSLDVTCPEQWREILSMEWVTDTLLHAAKCEQLDDAVSLKQSLAAAKRAGMSITAAEKLHEEIEAKEKALIDKLVEAETTQVLDLCGLGVLAASWRRWKEVQTNTGKQGTVVTMATYPGLSVDEMEASMKEFYASLYSPPLPSLETTIKDPTARRMARSKIAEAVCDIYEKIYESAMSSSSGYADTSFLGHTPDQVRTLFSA